jgi:drug/metabolite transporter (DMT)-like permease
MEQQQFDPRQRIIGILYAVTTALFWGFLAIAMKIGFDFVSPATMVWFRFTTAFWALFLFFSVKNRGKLRILIRPHWMLILAAAGLSLNYIGFANGVDYAGPATAQVFIQLGPMLLAVSGVVLFKERLSWRQKFGFLLAFAGFYLFYYEKIQRIGSDGSGDFIIGLAWIVMGATTWSVYAVLQKILVRTFSAQQLNLFIYGFAMVVYLPFVTFSEFSQLDGTQWAIMIFLGANTLIAYGCLAEAFKYVEANKISIIATMNPIITFVALSVMAYLNIDWIDQDPFSALMWIGAVTVLFAAIMVIMPKRKNRKKPRSHDPKAS